MRKSTAACRAKTQVTAWFCRTPYQTRCNVSIKLFEHFSLAGKPPMFLDLHHSNKYKRSLCRFPRHPRRAPVHRSQLSASSGPPLSSTWSSCSTRRAASTTPPTWMVTPILTTVACPKGRAHYWSHRSPGDHRRPQSCGREERRPMGAKTCRRRKRPHPGAHEAARQ